MFEHTRPRFGGAVSCGRVGEAAVPEGLMVLGPVCPLATTAPALLVRGMLERVDGVVNVVADRLELLPLGVTSRSRDFR